MTNEQIAYIAGIFDGEGHAGIHPRSSKDGGEKLSLVVKVTNNCLPLLVHIQELLGGRIALKDKQRARPTYDLWFTGTHAASVLELILPYLIAKKNVAKECIAFQAAPDHGQRFELQDKVRKLNVG